MKNKNPKDFSGDGTKKIMEMSSELSELKANEVEEYVCKWKVDFLNEVKDDFIKSKVDDICQTLEYFLFVNDESGTCMDPNEGYFFNFNRVRDKNIIWFSFYSRKALRA